MKAEVPSRLVADRDVASFCDAEHVRIVRVVFGIVGDRHVAEDLAQETFVRVYLHWERVQAADSPQAWTARVATNLANSWWRRRYAEARANRRHGVWDAISPPDMSTRLRPLLRSANVRGTSFVIPV